MSHPNRRSESTVERDILRKERYDLHKNLMFLSESDLSDIDVDFQELIESLNDLTQIYSDDKEIQRLIEEIQSSLPDIN